MPPATCGAIPAPAPPPPKSPRRGEKFLPISVPTLSTGPRGDPEIYFKK
ncbi:uncharacterized protein G2W53_029481 [Senna tora]|uniref:Uncharacterized protein n=1 Tax=Senna tora TaxID=362788 RepID=A0A834WAR6_9FABA|nr:uncharacterized protein G2W53_029481 [Senna tora]